ncbi:DUF222 domain-containing protein [Gordonia sp. TBRC 11910]|uniref:DUF222 domain-containing protein n=1 Tax=Gordonia asplenii TaxID=2725283 RepID=A0A848KYA6_9ACTN|nr:DUF222 domain-containing protein [Gordonia asplenii]NMO03339.1 DUF222 domain-containing protein [Gordonia asplenii]
MCDVVDEARLGELPVDQLYELVEVSVDHVAASSTTELSQRELAALLYTQERIGRKLACVGLQRVREAQDRAAFTAVGFTTLRQFLSTGIRLGGGPASRRITAANAVSQRRAVTGQPLPPHRPCTAEAIADGAIGEDHVTVIESVMTKIPAAVGVDRIAQAEKELAANARLFNPTDLAKIGDRLLAHLDPDGRLTDDRDRQRQRGLTLCPQDQQLMSTLKGLLTPTVRAMLEVILSAWAAPGMNNPDDEEPVFGPGDDPQLDPQVLAEARARDTRTQAQRNHDALAAMLRYVLGHGALGRPDRLPAEVVVTTSLAELANVAGFGYTATGTDIPVGDLVEIAAQAGVWLEVFADHTQEVLYLGRANRFASKAQRLALFGRDRGCTAPLCSVPFAHTEAHHAPDWAKNGHTDIDKLGAACGRHNRMVGSRPGQWETRVLDAGPHSGRMGWRPAGSDGPWQVNPVHRIDLPVEPIAVADPPTTGPAAAAPTAATMPGPHTTRVSSGGSAVERFLRYMTVLHRADITVQSVRLQT